MLVPAGYLGFKYWDTHHRGRRRREQEQGFVEEPPSFREFVVDQLFTKDLPPEGSEAEVSNALIEELDGIFYSPTNSSISKSKSDDLTVKCTFSSSESNASTSNDPESDTELDDEDDYEEEESSNSPIRLLEGLEYEETPDKQDTETRSPAPLGDSPTKMLRLPFLPRNLFK